ncbi:hypothetical protein DRQ21_09815 [Candidatus Fermentibacteria bacterium]|nr:MAG: hypothetical protein DRQ21_09815 [Candidatus Fermentibacteria bacterium]
MSSMTSRNASKINQVLQEWPKNTVATQPWLTLLGVSSKLANWHVGSGWLQRFGTGAYIRPGDQVEWQGGVYALQTQLDKTAHVGGQTALELQGLSHFIPIGQKRKILLVSDLQERLPTWFRNHQWNVNMEHRCLSLFEHVPEKSVTELDCGGFKITMSGRERAMMEQMRFVRSNSDLEQVYLLMEGLTTARPSMVQELLENCLSIKVKRLFLWNSEEAGHDWFNKLDLSCIDLGKGKRQIYSGGRYDRKYMITVPDRQELPVV